MIAAGVWAIHNQLHGSPDFGINAILTLYVRIMRPSFLEALSPHIARSNRRIRRIFRLGRGLSARRCIRSLLAEAADESGIMERPEIFRRVRNGADASGRQVTHHRAIQRARTRRKFAAPASFAHHFTAARGQRSCCALQGSRCGGYRREQFLESRTVAGHGRTLVPPGGRQWVFDA